MRPRFKPQTRHQNKNMKKYFFGDFFSALVCRAAPQGGFLSPHLWNLSVNSLLRRPEYSTSNAIAYVDDLTIIASEMCPQTLSDKLNLALSIVLNRCRVLRLSVNISKTNTILSTRRYRVKAVTLPSIRSVILRFFFSTNAYFVNDNT